MHSFGAYIVGASSTSLKIPQSKIDASLVQSVEQWSPKPLVACSSRAGRAY